MQNSGSVNVLTSLSGVLDYSQHIIQILGGTMNIFGHLLCGTFAMSASSVVLSVDTQINVTNSFNWTGSGATDLKTFYFHEGGQINLLPGSVSYLTTISASVNLVTITNYGTLYFTSSSAVMLRRAAKVINAPGNYPYTSNFEGGFMYAQGTSFSIEEVVDTSYSAGSTFVINRGTFVTQLAAVIE